jgi:hypothetical protein
LSTLHQCVGEGGDAGLAHEFKRPLGYQTAQDAIAGHIFFGRCAPLYLERAQNSALSAILVTTGVERVPNTVVTGALALLAFSPSVVSSA